MDHDLPAACYDGAGVRGLDHAFMEATGVYSESLMCWAGRWAFKAITRRWPEAHSITIFCGGGNNGGDGYVIAQAAREAGWAVHVVGLRPVTNLAGAARAAAKAYQDAGGLVEPWHDDVAPASDVVVDALLGTGVDRNVEGIYAAAIDAINRSRRQGCAVVAVDVPSGLTAGTGKIQGTCVRADLTPTFIGLKLGLLTADGPAVAGRIVFDDLGAPAMIYSQVQPHAMRVTQAEVLAALGPRLPTAYKNQHGTLACIGGNRGTGGAIRLTAEAALRAGSGLVSVGCHPDFAPAMSQARPELMAAGIDATDDESSLFDTADIVALGPGLGKDDWAKRRFQAAMACDKPLVLDADGLNHLASSPVARGHWILTPHPGEAGRLLDCSTAEIAADRRAAVLALAKRYNAVALLKGAGTLISDGHQVAVNTTGNPGMAVGGMGDLLTGVIASLWGQGLSAFDAARLGVRVHGTAGDDAINPGGPRGLLPADLLPHLRAAVNPSAPEDARQESTSSDCR